MSVTLVTGTDTGIGKTVVTAALVARAGSSGRRVAGVKPVQTGAAPGEPGDVDEVVRLTGTADTYELQRLPDPLALRQRRTARRHVARTPRMGRCVDPMVGGQARQLGLVSLSLR